MPAPTLGRRRPLREREGWTRQKVSGNPPSSARLSQPAKSELHVRSQSGDPVALDDIKDVRRYLEAVGRYDALLDRHNAAPVDRSIWFEMVFAYWLEDTGTHLAYEIPKNPENDSSIDFVATAGGHEYLMELVRIENSEEVAAHVEEQMRAYGIYALLLKGDHHNQYFRTAAQLIRVQEKILEKVAKFPRPDGGRVACVVVDCSNIHAGGIDDEDIRMTVFGRARNPNWQEYWGKQRLLGLFEAEFGARGIELLRERVNVIIFVNKLAPGALSTSFFAVNPFMAGGEVLRRIPAFGKLQQVG